MALAAGSDVAVDCAGRVPVAAAGADMAVGGAKALVGTAVGIGVETTAGEQAASKALAAEVLPRISRAR
jgi:hypothetical protein